MFWGAFNWSIELTNTERFCISCHAMRDYVFKEYRKTIHYNNRTGVRATCPDCHVPREWIHKVIRKVRATNELFHWMLGSIDSPEAFEAKRPVLARQVWGSMKSTNSRECRNCHGMDFMATKKQAPDAKTMHELGESWRMTCIDCHKGISHTLPRGYDKEAAMDLLHERMEREKVKCDLCHKDMTKPPKGQNW
jgi:cytochrome c-type protein NapC